MEAAKGYRSIHGTSIGIIRITQGCACPEKKSAGIVVPDSHLYSLRIKVSENELFAPALHPRSEGNG
jgi:hypothetical protein